MGGSRQQTSGLQQQEDDPLGGSPWPQGHTRPPSRQIPDTQGWSLCSGTRSFCLCLARRGAARPACGLAVRGATLSGWPALDNWGEEAGEGAGLGRVGSPGSSGH